MIYIFGILIFPVSALGIPEGHDFFNVARHGLLLLMTFKLIIIMISVLEIFLTSFEYNYSY